MASDDLFEAIRDNDGPRVRALLAEDPALAGARNATGVSALLHACYHGRPQLARVLVEHGAPLDVFEAAALGDASRLRALIDADPTLANAVAPDGFSPLGLAAFFGHCEVVALLLARGASPTVASRNAMRVTPLHSAAAHRESASSLSMCRELLSHGANPNVRQQGGWTPMHEAAAHGNLELASLLLGHGARAQTRSDDGRTPIDMALASGHSAVAELLRSHGGAAAAEA
jgi:ankyrin repeat protein